MRKFNIEKGLYGKKMVVCDAFTEDMASYCAKNKIAGLELNWAKGFKGDDLSFLKNLHFLKSFTICDYNIKDISPIHHLENLRQLDISTYCKTPLDFAAFDRLEELSLFWRPGIKSLSKCNNLRRLFLYKYNPPTKDLSEIAKLTNLRALSLKIPTIFSIGDVAAMEKLESLGIYGATKLTDIAGLGKLKNLKELNIDCCKKINDFDTIMNLQDLEHLSLSNDGPIKSLAPVAKLKKLKDLYFIESTNIKNGDLSCLKELPGLTKISFQNRKHYNLKREQFNAYN